MKIRFFTYPLSIFFGGVLYSHAETVKNQNIAKDTDADVITITAPVTSPLEIITSPKKPRQPVPASDGSDYLKTIPGFSQIRNGGTNGDPVFRGMFGSRLKILTDGAEMLGACPSRMDAPTSYIAPEDFDLLSLIKGPETVIWGPGNSAGTIRFDRETPSFETNAVKGTASVLAGSRDRYDGNADISLGGKKGYLRLTGNKSRSSDYKDGNGKNVHSGWDKWNSDITVGITPEADRLIEFSAGTGNAQAAYAGRAMDGTEFKRQSLGMRFVFSDLGPVFDKLEGQINYNYARHVMDNYSLRRLPQNTGGHGMHMMHADSGPMHHMQGMKMGGKMIMPYDRRTVSGRLMGTWDWEDVKLEAGTDTQMYTHRSVKMYNPDTSGAGPWNKDARFHDYGIFAQTTWNVNNDYDLITGARIDHAQMKSFKNAERKRDAYLPAGFVRTEHTFSDKKGMMYAGLGYVKRFPDYWELFSSTNSKYGLEDAFTYVRPEETTQLDIGTQYNIGDITTWISFYTAYINNYIIFQYDPSDKKGKTSKAYNVRARTLGAESGLSWQFIPDWKFDTSLAWSWGQNITEDQPLPQMPPLEGRFALTWDKNDWSTTVLWRVVSQQNRIALNEGNVVGKDIIKSPGFTVLSANAAYKFTKDIKLSIGADNLLNKSYAEHLNLAGNSGFGYSTDTIFNEPGRTYWAKLNVVF